MNKIEVLVININNLDYTKNCINDLLNQNVKDFNITLVDQGSNEIGTYEYLDSLFNNDRIKIIRNDHNVDLTKIWNNFCLDSNSEYLCYLNNDVKITDNFIDDTINILDSNKNIGIVIHSTNSFKYNKKLPNLEYKQLNYRIKQGWDFTIRKKLYTIIPQEIRFYYGDDWLFHYTYEQGYNVAICTSSPIIHYAEKSAKYSPISYKDDEVFYKSYGLEHYLPHYNEYNEILPTFKNFGDDPIKTIIFLGLNCSNINNDVYIINDKFTDLNNRILDQCKGSILSPPDKSKIMNVDRYLKDSLKIEIAKSINQSIQNGYNIWGWYDVNTLFTLPLYLDYLPNPHFVCEFVINKDIINNISLKYNVNYEQSLNIIDIYNLKLIEFLFEYRKIIDKYAI